MDKRIKEILRDFLDKQYLIPWRVWWDVLWIQRERTLGITRYRRFVWTDKRGKHESNWQNFFRKCKVHWNEHEILQCLKDYQLFFKLDTLTAQDVIYCSNVEIRRLLLNNFGPIILYQLFFRTLVVDFLPFMIE